MSLVETIVAMALTLVLSATILSLVTAGQRIARTQPEAADLQQRARIAMRTLAAELRDAGAGIERGALSGALMRYFPPVAPSVDGGVTIWRTDDVEAQAYPAVAVALGATTIPLQDAGVCPGGQAACAFAAASSAIAFTAAGCRTTARIAAPAGDSLQLASPLAACGLDPASAIAAGQVRTYRLDPVARQLVRRDEVTGSSAPLLEGVAAFTVTYFADASATLPIDPVTEAGLMRARLVRVALRLTTTNVLLHVPDLSIAFDVAPRNAETDR